MIYPHTYEDKIGMTEIRALLRSNDISEGEGWAVRLQGLEDELLPVSRRQLAKVRAALGEHESGA